LANSEVADLVQSIVEAIVDDPDSITIKETEDDRTTNIEVSTAKEDVGKVIGKRGAMAKALRTIMASISGKRDHRYMLHILESFALLYMIM